MLDSKLKQSLNQTVDLSSALQLEIPNELKQPSFKLLNHLIQQLLLLFFSKGLIEH